MRWVVPLLICAALLSPGACAYYSFRETGLVNKALGNLDTPQISPGDSGFLSFNVTNMHSDETMDGVAVTVGIYRYMTVNEVKDIRAIESPPIFTSVRGGNGAVFSNGSTQVVFCMEPLGPGESRRCSLRVATSDETPHGDYFSQAAYAVRFRMSFHSANGSFVYQSKGFFEESAWDGLYNETDEGPRFEKGRLLALGVDGVIPDTTIGVRKEIPKLCMYGLYAGVAGLLVTGYLFYVWENPSAFPWLYGQMALARGKVIRRRGPPKE